MIDLLRTSEFSSERRYDFCSLISKGCTLAHWCDLCKTVVDFARRQAWSGVLVMRYVLQNAIDVERQATVVGV